MSPFLIFIFESGVWQLNNKIKYLHSKNHLGPNLSSETLFQLISQTKRTKDRDKFHPSPIYDVFLKKYLVAVQSLATPHHFGSDHEVYVCLPIGLSVEGNVINLFQQISLAARFRQMKNLFVKNM